MLVHLIVPSAWLGEGERNSCKRITQFMFLLSHLAFKIKRDQITFNRTSTSGYPLCFYRISSKAHSQ